MRILVPNSTASMTADTEIVALDPGHGPVSIEGHYNGAFCLPGLLQCIRRGKAERFDGFVVTCFDDPGIGACREVATGPVVGICETAMYAAAMVASGFSVVTTLPRSVPVIEELAPRYGIERRLRKVRAAVKLVEALVGLGLRTSKVGGYASPLPKRYAGELAHHAFASHDRN